MNTNQILYTAMLEYTDNICEGLVQNTLDLLEAVGVTVGAAYGNASYAARLILLAEAVNLAAKWIDEDFYNIKHQLVNLAAAENSNRFYLDQGGCPSLYNKEIGVAAFHDPYDELDYSLLCEWSFQWSGVRRQNQAFELLIDEELLRSMAQATRPRKR